MFWSPLRRADTMTADFHHAMGLNLLQAGQHHAALTHLEQAIALRADDPALLEHLGVARLRAQQLEGALAALQQALSLQPDNAQTAYNLACVHIARRDGAAAKALLEPLLAKNAKQPQWISALGDSLRILGDWRRAIRYYRDALALDSTLASTRQNLSLLLMHGGQHDEAIEYARQAVAQDPRNPTTHWHLGNALAAKELYEEAMDAYADGHDLQANHVPLNVAIGRCFLGQGESVEAANWFHKALAIAPDDLSALCGLAAASLELDAPDEALALLLPHRERGERDAEYLLALADAHWDDGDADNALATLDQLRTLQPQFAGVHLRRGNILSSSGDVPGAIACFEQALTDAPELVGAINGLAAAQRGKLAPELVARAQTLLAQPALQDGRAASLNFALAYYHDGLKQAEPAAKYLRAANQHQWASRSRHGWTYDLTEQAERVDEMIDCFSAEFFARHHDIGHPDATPAFIVGMPRSGTTLTEQILARHSQVLGIGERNFATRAFHAFRQAPNRRPLSVAHALKNLKPERLRHAGDNYLRILHALIEKSGKPGVSRVVDKMPDNYMMVGWIALLFPNAKIIHSRRDVRDVAMSCFQTQFGAIRWACHPEHLVERIRQYQRIMQHWRTVLPGRFLESDYEALTDDQETESRKLVSWLGLDWEPACLSFYESDRLVRTASITQVRQPIYRSSVAKWKAYEPYLPDLLLPLAELNHTPLR